jgi:hypothetical protein
MELNWEVNPITQGFAGDQEFILKLGPLSPVKYLTPPSPLQPESVVDVLLPLITNH